MKVVRVQVPDSPLRDSSSYTYIFPNGKTVVGETYTVVGHVFNQWDGYILAEKPCLSTCGRECGHSTRLFVPLDYYQAEFTVNESHPTIKDYEQLRPQIHRQQ